ncbi:MAG: hypothetical protein RSB88_01135 [Akkermansia sp.]
MNDLDSHTTTETVIDELFEQSLYRLRCAEVPHEVMTRLIASCQNAFTEGVSARVSESLTCESAAQQLSPKIVSEHQISSWARLMDDAARSETESRLSRLSPSGTSEMSQMRCTLAMERASTSNAVEVMHSNDQVEKKEKVARQWRHYVLRWGSLAAGLCFLAIALSFLIPWGEDVSEIEGISSADLNRTTSQIVEEGVDWNSEQGGAQRKYHVDYEDSVEVTDKKGNRVIVSVPSSKKVVVPVQVY